MTPITIGPLTLHNRVFMSPLTRLRGTTDHLPRPEIMADYYRQRAGAGLIITEGVPVDPMGVGYACVPGIWSRQQAELWQPITDAVHEAGGTIFMQLWHVGRISHPMFLNGRLPVAPSAVRPSGHISLVRPKTPYETPRALQLSEVRALPDQFANGAENARFAGFDGVELHGANGYLLDQFLQTKTNQREDEYGGDVEGRARLMLECCDAAVGVFGAGRVGMHLAPRCDDHDIGDANPAATFGYVAKKLGRRGIGFIVARERLGPDSLSPDLKKAFGGVYVLNEEFNQKTAEQALLKGTADAIAFGKSFLANPDLPVRFVSCSHLNEPIAETFYTHEALGYADYPSLPPA